MKITVLCVGKIKEKYWSDAIAEYMKRLSKYCTADIQEVADEKTDEKASEKEEELVKEKEGQRLLSKIPDQAYVITLTIGGKSFDSVEMSKMLENFGIRGKDRIVFVIGGSLGLSDKVQARADEAWSFSKLTFPHQMMRVILLEQIYRSFRIMKNEPYHK